MSEKLEKKPHSEKRRRQERFVVRVDEDEYKFIVDRASHYGITPAELMRSLALGTEPKSQFDKKVCHDLFRLHGDLNRLGGLFKMAISTATQQGGPSSSEVSSCLKEIKTVSLEIKEKISSL